MTSTVYFTAAPSSLSFIAAASPLSAPPLCSLKVACERERDGKRDIKGTRAVCEEEKVCVGVYVDGTSHSSVCPGFDTVRARCKTRANKDCLKEEVHCAPLSASFGRGFCLEESLEYFVGPECFSIPPEAASPSACV